MQTQTNQPTNQQGLFVLSVQIDQPQEGRLGMPSINFYLKNDSDPVVRGYKKYMRDIGKIFQPSEKELNKFVKATYGFEKKLAAVSNTTHT